MTIRQQAEYHRILIAMEYMNRENVVAWADGLVLRGDAPIAIINLSLAVDADERRLDSLLTEVQGDGDLPTAAHAALYKLKEELPRLTLKEAVGKITKYGHAIERISNDESHDATLFKVYYDEMIEGYCGTEMEVWTLLREYVHRHATEPSKF